MIVERHVTLAEADAFCLSYNGPDGDCQAVIVPEGVMTSPAFFPWGIGGKYAAIPPIRKVVHDGNPTEKR